MVMRSDELRDKVYMKLREDHLQFFCAWIYQSCVTPVPVECTCQVNPISGSLTYLVHGGSGNDSLSDFRQ